MRAARSHHQLSGGLSGRHTGAGSSFYGFDLSANTRQLLDALGQVSGQYLYSAFGVELAAGADQPLRFGGQVGYWRDEAERVYVRARHYLPGVGRWGSRDPVAPFASISAGSAYRYAANSPGSHADPSGLWSCGDVSNYANFINHFLAAVDAVLAYVATWFEPELIPGWIPGVSRLLAVLQCITAGTAALADWVRCEADRCSTPCPPDEPCELCTPILQCLASLAAIVATFAISAPHIALTVSVGLMVAAPLLSVLDTVMCVDPFPAPRPPYQPLDPFGHHAIQQRGYFPD